MHQAGKAAPAARIRFVQVAGFAALLVIMAVAAVDALRALDQAQATHFEIQQNFVSREQALEHIRSSLYRAGTVARDYLLLESGEDAAQAMRAELQQIRDEMEGRLLAYSRALRPSERDSYHRLQTEVQAYWAVLEPILSWDAEQKRRLGYRFVHRELLPRRVSVLQIAARIATLNERTLRDGNQRTAEVFGLFRRRLNLLFGLGLGLGVLVAVLSSVYILRLERIAFEKHGESLRAQAELRELSARLVKIQEEERRAISRELHDEVGQSLTALLMDLSHLLAADPADGAFLRQHLGGIRKLAEGSAQTVHDMALLLRPSMLDDLGLVPALEWLAREIGKRAGLRVQVLDENVSDSLPDEIRTCVYRVVQEALHNCCRHAQARNVRIVVRQEMRRLLLTVQDDGIGFDTSRVRGLGLVGMSERVTSLRGSFQVDSQPGHGTLLRAVLPLALEPSSRSAESA